MQNDKEYLSTNEVAKELLVSPTTVRKYTNRLEDKGYIIKKNDKGWRQYNSKDVAALDYLCLLRPFSSSLEDTIESVVSLYRSRPTIAQPKLLKPKEDPVDEFVKSQEIFNEALINGLDEQQEHIENSLKERDELIMTSLKEASATKLLITVKLKKKWYQFWQ